MSLLSRQYMGDEVALVPAIRKSLRLGIWHGLPQPRWPLENVGRNIKD